MSFTCTPAWLAVQEVSVGGPFWKDLVWIQNALRIHYTLQLSHEVEFQGAVLACGVVTLQRPQAVLSRDRASELHRVREQPRRGRAHQVSLIVVKDEGWV